MSKTTAGWIGFGIILIAGAILAAIPQADALSTAASRIFGWDVILAIIGGSIAGIIIGALPGISPVAALGVVMPLTFTWDATVSMYFIMSIAGAAVFAGAVPSILLNVPGDPPNAATCFDGYPMTRKGQAGRALGAAAMATICGSTIGIIILIILLPFVRAVVLSFSAPEFFWLMIAAIVAVAFSIRSNMLKGLFAGGVGLLVAMIGYSDTLLSSRFAGESYTLYDGVDIALLVTGIFALSEMFSLQIEGKGKVVKFAGAKITGVRQGVIDVFRYPGTFIRSSIIGTIVGILPGVGGMAAAFICYGFVVKSSKHPDTFGKGDVEGVIAPQFAIAAERGGAALPTVAFGIPGSTLMALVLGAFVLHGIVPGPLLVRDHLDIVWAIIGGLAIATAISALLGLFSSKYMAKIAEIGNYYLIPVVIVLCIAADYGDLGNIWDLGLLIVMAVFGWILKETGYPVICFTMGYILGTGTETDFWQTLMTYDGNWTAFFTRPIALVEFLIVLALVLIPIIGNIAGPNKKKAHGRISDGMEMVK